MSYGTCKKEIHVTISTDKENSLVDKEAKTGGWVEGYTDKVAMVHGSVRKLAKHTSGEEPRGAWDHKHRNKTYLKLPLPILKPLAGEECTKVILKGWSKRGRNGP